ncbi:MAG: hypothetical protein ABH879_03885 [archaeon]
MDTPQALMITHIPYAFVCAFIIAEIWVIRSALRKLLRGLEGH